MDVACGFEVWLHAVHLQLCADEHPVSHGLSHPQPYLQTYSGQDSLRGCWSVPLIDQKNSKSPKSGLCQPLALPSEVNFSSVHDPTRECLSHLRILGPRHAVIPPWLCVLVAALPYHVVVAAVEEVVEVVGQQ